MIEDEEDNNDHESNDEDNHEYESEEEDEILDAVGNSNSDENGSLEQEAHNENEE